MVKKRYFQTVMIKLLKSNIPLVYAFSILFVFACSSEVFLQGHLDRYNFFSWYASFLDYVKNTPVLDYLLTSLLIIGTGDYINKAFNKTSFFQKTTGFPIFIFLAFLSTFEGFYFETSHFIDFLFALVFLKLIELDQNRSAIHVSFLAGIIIGIGFLFSYWVIPLGLLIFFSLSTFRPFQWREYAVGIVGMSLPTVYLLTIRYILYGSYSISPKVLTALPRTNYWYDYSSYFLLVVIVMYSLLKLRKQFSHISNIERKQINILAFFTVLTFLISAGIFWAYKIQYFIFIVPLTLLVAIPILNSKHDRLMNIFFTILIILNLLRIFLF